MTVGVDTASKLAAVRRTPIDGTAGSWLHGCRVAWVHLHDVCANRARRRRGYILVGRPRLQCSLRTCSGLKMHDCARNSVITSYEQFVRRCSRVAQACMPRFPAAALATLAMARHWGAAVATVARHCHWQCHARTVTEWPIPCIHGCTCTLCNIVTVCISRCRCNASLGKG